ncbi:MAG: hypothetical protein NVV82_14080 [Sporocytophaga sp.]|nr:hypothetical protein [Sporocytophaga sp.]
MENCLAKVLLQVIFFSPELAGVGEHKIVYTYTYGLCMDTISAIFTVVKFDPSTNIPTVKATALSPSQIKVEWTRSPEAEEYTIMRGHNFGNQIIADHIPGNIVSYIDTNLVAGETYTYTVIATKRSLFYYSNPSEAVTLLPDGIDSKHDRILCNIYPDPSSGTFTIDIGTFVHGYTYVLSDVVGNIILEGPLTDEKTFIQLLDPIVNGLYNIRINKDGYILSRKILIIR